MNQRGKNKLKMYHAVALICTQHPTEWNGLPAFTTAFAQFTGKLQELEQLSYTQQCVTLGVTAGKDQLLRAAINRADTIANALRAYAAVTNDLLLGERLRFSRWDFRNGGSQAFIGKLDVILESAYARAADLPDYGIVQTDIDELAALRAQAAQVMTRPRHAVIDRSQATKAMNETFRDLDGLLKDHLDHLVEVLRSAHPDFYLLYKGARVIVDYRGRRIASSSEEGK